MKYWRLCAAVCVATCSICGYEMYGWNGGALGLLGAASIALCIELGINVWRAYTSRANTGAGRTASLPAGLKHASNGIVRRRTHSSIHGHTVRHMALASAFVQQPARNIRSFWCYRTREKTLIFVRLRAGRLYCLHMRRSGSGEGARWVVGRVEGEEYGSISAYELKLARIK